MAPSILGTPGVLVIPGLGSRMEDHADFAAVVASRSGADTGASNTTRR